MMDVIFNGSAARKPGGMADSFLWEIVVCYPPAVRQEVFTPGNGGNTGVLTGFTGRTASSCLLTGASARAHRSYS